MGQLQLRFLQMRHLCVLVHHRKAMDAPAIKIVTKTYIYFSNKKILVSLDVCSSSNGIQIAFAAIGMYERKNKKIKFCGMQSSNFRINLVSPSLNASRKSFATVGQSVAQK
uniref:Uncharacterized protein n=1 Tax=Romanomermis culicivorax TaxID=13658 RepID=A0A915IQV5_ROMCU